MKIAIVTDTWLPEVNGVVVTMQHTAQELTVRGHDIVLITPDGFRTIGMPGYRTIRLALFPKHGVARILDAERPDAIHISTEGPLGLAARRYCLDNRLDFTTCYHTRFPEYVRARAPIPLGISYAWMRRFHQPARHVMVSTPTLARELAARGFRNVVLWNKGVDTELFRPRERSELIAERPIWMYVGRVAVEKNLKAFLSLELPGTRYVVGDGPDIQTLKARYPSARFTGFLLGQDLARHLASADVMVFPSRTDTYGLVQLEAMACGVPVAAFPVTGPLDIIEQGVTGYCDENLRRAALACLELDGARCREYALKHGWAQVATQFLDYMVPVSPARERLAG
jgi:glycosyltransferase involved in cell wall biosynthesis